MAAGRVVLLAVAVDLVAVDPEAVELAAVELVAAGLVAAGLAVVGLAAVELAHRGAAGVAQAADRLLALQAVGVPTGASA